MKIAICLIGISYGIRNRDFRKTYPNIKEYLIKDYPVYLGTYKHQFVSELLELYKPKSALFLDYPNNRMDTYARSLNLLQNEDVDFIISSRFDISFKKDFYYGIDYEKFNFLFSEKNVWFDKQFVTDNLFAFPKKYLNDFIHILGQIDQTTTYMHHVYTPIKNKIGQDNINFISYDLEFSHDNQFYTLERSEW